MINSEQDNNMNDNIQVSDDLEIRESEISSYFFYLNNVSTPEETVLIWMGEIPLLIQSLQEYLKDHSDTVSK